MGASIAGVIVAFSVSGCQRDRERAVVTTTAPAAPQRAIGGGPLEVPTALEHIVEARCVREDACGFIGEEGKWASHEACVEVVAREYADDLTAVDCANGVDGKALWSVSRLHAQPSAARRLTSSAVSRRAAAELSVSLVVSRQSSVERGDDSTDARRRAVGM